MHYYLPFALAAYFLNGVAVLVDKFLLSHKITHPLIYIFYISLVSLVILIFIPFITRPSLEVFLLASTSTILWTAGLYMLYKALCVGLVTRVVPIIGALIPILLLIYAAVTGAITSQEMMAVIVLIFGILFLTLFEIRGKMHKKELQYELLSAILFAISYIVLRNAYLQEHFFTVFVWSRVILIPFGIFIILIPQSRRIVFGTAEKPHLSFLSKTGVLFIIGQVAGGISELLLTFSVSLANPALVNSLQGSQYVFLFIASFFLARKFPHVFAERHAKWAVVSKLFGIALVAIGLYIMATAG
jgi:drug/metabolite transporter (DMT)-like permease